ncbi:F0F1 ATP synthase subunit gamma [Actinocorallia longicatena]|uniref:ATP synthase gamma chain n=1 Tax=Actinocorallia longicatena TaxID=111803 RepID=A0ABP6QKT4_9ACTN
MGAELRRLRVRIRSVKSTAKITRAQEMIAASKISKAQARQAASEPYARHITRAVTALISHHVSERHPLLDRKTDASRVAILLVTSDRGFCGGYNANILRHGQQLARALRDQGREPVFYVTGRRGVDNYLFNDRPMAGQWSGQSGEPGYGQAAEIGEALMRAFLAETAEGGVGEVHVVYTRFQSMLSQELTVRRILPLEIEDVEVPPEGEPVSTFDFEPSSGEVLDDLMGQYIRGRIWNMLLEAAASEHAARRRAMMSATDNANDLVTKLTRQANEARQAEVTNELNEIVGGANALADSVKTD